MSPPDIQAALYPVADLLDELGVRWHVCGSVASSAHGAARATLDVDIVADLQEEHVARFVQGLLAAYYVPESLVRDAVARRTSFNLIHLDTMLKVDIFLLKPREYDRLAFARAREDTLEPHDDARKLLLSSPEDVVLSKLRWYRSGGEVSDRQWQDVQGVLKVQAGRLDLDYLQRWAAALGLTDLLERSFAESES